MPYDQFSSIREGDKFTNPEVLYELPLYSVVRIGEHDFTINDKEAGITLTRHGGDSVEIPVSYLQGFDALIELVSIHHRSSVMISAPLE